MTDGYGIRGANNMHIEAYRILNSAIVQFSQTYFS